MVRECISDQDIMTTYSVMQQLRPFLTEDTYLKTIHTLMNEDKVRLIAAFANNTCVACSLFRILHKLNVNGQKILESVR